MRRHTRKRTGFTLIEMMVVVALTLFIMVILSTAFSTGLETFRQLKAIGDMQDQLRTATNMLRADLGADHFEGKRRLSDTNFWTVGPPREGFLRITQLTPPPPLPPLPPPATPPTVPPYEGADADGLWSRRCVDHVIHMTVKRRGNRPGDFFSAPVLDTTTLSPLLAANYQPQDGRFQDPTSGSVFNSQWVEVAWFLSPAPNPSNQATANGTPLYGLYRQQRVVIPDPSALNLPANRITVPAFTPLTAYVNYLNPFSCSLQPVSGGVPPKQYVYFNSPSGLTIPERRLGMQLINNQPTYIPSGQPGSLQPRFDSNGTPTGDDLVMTNVISFDVQVVRSDIPGQVSDLSIPNGYTAPYFDTWSSLQDELMKSSQYLSPPTPPFYPDATTIPQTYRINGIQITLRVWDARTQQTRQITIFQEM